MALIDRRNVLGAGVALTAMTMVPDYGLAGSSTGLDAAQVAALRTRCNETGSDAVLVYRNGVKIFEYYSGTPEPIFLMSCTKSIVSLAVGAALADGKIKSVDQPLYEFYPELKQGRKQALTIRHLLSMTSGIQNTGTGSEVYPAPDFVRLAVAAELTTAPGAAFDYNNKSVNLLSGVIHLATGEFLDDYVRDKFFEPMGIKSWNWGRDDAGNASAMADLALYPEDFAKFGMLMQQRGLWKGKQLLPASWVDQVAQQSQPYEPLYGLLWWRTPLKSVGRLTPARIETLRQAGLKPDFIAAIRPLSGRSFASEADWHRALEAVMPDWEAKAPEYPGVIDYYATDIPIWTYESFDGLQAEGSLGQYLAVFPKSGLVGVRMKKPTEDFHYNRNRFEDFADVVRSLAG